MLPPLYWPWDPRQQVPPGLPADGVWGTLTAWGNLMYVLTNRLPAAWNELFSDLHI